jgi:hypothetical protein
MKDTFSAKFKLLLKKILSSIKEFQQILKLCEMIVSLVIFYLTRKKVSFV